MATSKPKVMRGSVPRDLSRKPAPDAGWKMLKGQKQAKPAPEPEPALEPPAAELVVQIVVVFTVDGQPVANVPMQGMMPRPAADQQGVTMHVGLDARVVAKALEPYVGPSNASVKIWKPGDPNPPLIRH